MGNDAYADLVNTALNLTGTQQFRVQEAAAQQRVVKLVEDYARTLPDGTPEFDHYLPAEVLLTTDAGASLSGLDAALDRFEQLFTDLNALLPALPPRPAPAPARRVRLTTPKP